MSEIVKPKKDLLEKMAIRDILPGSSHGNLTSYSHNLTPEQRQSGYRVNVESISHNEIMANLLHQGKLVGTLSSVLDHPAKTVKVGIADVDEEHQKKGLGKQLYEATYAHALHHHNVNTVRGDYHSDDAAQVHSSLARKHGLEYVRQQDLTHSPTPNKPYSYKIDKTENSHMTDKETDHEKHDDIKKSNYGPKGAGLYDPANNAERKKNNVGEAHESLGPNQNVKSYSSKPGQLSAKKQAALENSRRRIKELSGPVRTLSREEIAKLNITPPGVKKADDMLEVEADGKQEVVEGKEPLKKDPKEPDKKVHFKQAAAKGGESGLAHALRIVVKEGKDAEAKARWQKLKKAIHHDEAFMSLEDELESDEDEQQQPPPEQPGQQEQAPQDDSQEQPQQESADDSEPLEAVSDESQGDEAPPEEAQEEDDDQQPDPAEGGNEPLEAVSEGGEEQPEEDSDEEDPEEGNGDVNPDPQELADALKEEGYTDQEIAYIVHGHHAPEVDPSKQAKAQATLAMSDLDLDSASQMANIERDHAKRTMDHEHEHKRRMADLEYQNAQKKGNLADIDEKHRQRMLDLEFENAQKQKQMEMEQTMQAKQMEMQQAQASAPDAESDKATARELKQIEVQKKKLELKIREEEMKLELEFKKREHELKLKMMEQQIKEQAKQKSEISGVKHEQRLAEAKNPPPKPKTAKKPLKKSEDVYEQSED